MVEARKNEDGIKRSTLPSVMITSSRMAKHLHVEMHCKGITTRFEGFSICYMYAT